MNVEFKEATIAEVIEFLAKKDAGFNAVVQPSVQTCRVSLKLRNVTSGQVLSALPFASEGAVELENLPDVEIVGVKAVMPPAVVGEDGLPIRPECRIFSLAAYLAGKDEKAGAAAIEQFHRSLNAAVEMLNNASPQARVKTPQLQVNPETKLLIAVGLPDDLAVVEQLVTALQGSSAAPIHGYRKEGSRTPMALPGMGMPGGPQPGGPPSVEVPGIPPGGLPGSGPNALAPRAPGAGAPPQPVPNVPALKR
jgi:hypothetical protein